MAKVKNAAMKLASGLIVFAPKPLRHSDIIHALAAAGMNTPIQGQQGFLTDEGYFVNRTEAARLALEAGQTKYLRAPPNLFSEDVW